MSFLKGTMTILGIALCLLGQSAESWAAITQIRQLNFGRWFIPSNNVQHTIMVAINGSVSTSSSDLIMFTTPVTGLYRITGLTPFGSVTDVNVTMTTPLTYSGGQMTVDDFTTQVPPADGLGVTFLTVGATLSTSGNGVGYGAGLFLGDIFIEVDY